MEIFGIPVVLIFIFVILIWSDYAQKQQKEKEELAKKWDAISTGMIKEDVFGRLGKPNRVVEMGAQEAWGYGPSKSDGEIAFIEGRVVGFQKPSCTLNVTVLPKFNIIVPQNESALDDNVTLTVKASDASGVVAVYFYFREPDETDEGKQIGYENLAATFNETTGHWEYQLDTTGLPYSFYFILAKAVDNSGNEGWEGVDVGKGTLEDVVWGYGESYYQSGDYQKAIENFERNIFSINHVYSYCSLAYLHATCPDSKFRDGEKAYELAKKACELTNFEDASCLSILAAAYAECGDFQKAIEYQEIGIKLIGEEVTEEWEKELETYKSGKPYRKHPDSQTQ